MLPSWNWVKGCLSQASLQAQAQRRAGRRAQVLPSDRKAVQAQVSGHAIAAARTRPARALAQARRLLAPGLPSGHQVQAHGLAAPHGSSLTFSRSWRSQSRPSGLGARHRCCTGSNLPAKVMWRLRSTSETSALSTSSSTSLGFQKRC